MARFQPGGYGQEAYGDPMGAGGPLHVVRARAVKSHVVRVVFDEEPLHRSAASPFDARNPANYVVQSIQGAVVDPFFGLAGFVQAVGVEPEPILPGAAGVQFDPPLTVFAATNATPVEITTTVPHGLTTGDLVRVSAVTGNSGANGIWRVTVNGIQTFTLDGSMGNGAYTGNGIVQAMIERGFDVHVDRALVTGMVYRVIASGVRSQFDGLLGAPVSAEFAGIAPRPSVNPPRQPFGLRDVRNDIATGAWPVDDSGDLGNEDGLASLRKRIFRRLTTGKGAFAFLPNYGVGLKLKELASVAELPALQADVIQQVGREPEVAQVTANVSIQPLGVLTVTMNVLTRVGAVVDLVAQRGQDGRVVIG